MRFNILFPLLVLSCLCVAWAQANFNDCCLFYDKGMTRRIRKHATTCRTQEVDGDCNIRAKVFTMKSGRVFCADPEAPWVTVLCARIKSRKNYKKSFQHWRDRA